MTSIKAMKLLFAGLILAAGVFVVGYHGGKQLAKAEIAAQSVATRK